MFNIVLVAVALRSLSMCEFLYDFDIYVQWEHYFSSHLFVVIIVMCFLLIYLKQLNLFVWWVFAGSANDLLSSFPIEVSCKWRISDLIIPCNWFDFSYISWHETCNSDSFISLIGNDHLLRKKMDWTKSATTFLLFFIVRMNQQISIRYLCLLRAKKSTLCVRKQVNRRTRNIECWKIQHTFNLLNTTPSCIEATDKIRVAYNKLIAINVYIKYAAIPWQKQHAATWIEMKTFRFKVHNNI